jgi:hypothetical protein
MADVPKRIKRLLREYAAAAHEEDLRRALLPVSEVFGQWASRILAALSAQGLAASNHGPTASS